MLWVLRTFSLLHAEGPKRQQDSPESGQIGKKKNITIPGEHPVRASDTELKSAWQRQMKRERRMQLGREAEGGEGVLKTRPETLAVAP